MSDVVGKFGSAINEKIVQVSPEPQPELLQQMDPPLAAETDSDGQDPVRKKQQSPVKSVSEPMPQLQEQQQPGELLKRAYSEEEVTPQVHMTPRQRRDAIKARRAASSQKRSKLK